MQRTDSSGVVDLFHAPPPYLDVQALPVDTPQKPYLDEKRAVRRLFDRLADYGVNYCHWKSNIRLGETLAGAQDIDLLVDPRDASLFQAVLLKCGFRLAVSRSGSNHPAVFHALALDDATAALVDLHAYHQIVSGDSLVKSYRFPVEAALLKMTGNLAGVRVPKPEAELVLFVLRMALKHVSPIEILKVNRHYEAVTTELSWLREQSDDPTAAALCAAWFPSVSPELFTQLLAAIGKERALVRRVVLGWWLSWRLRGLRRVGSLRAMASRYLRLMSFSMRRLSRRRDLALQAGGAIIALVGPKGTGKSTISRLLADRLGRYLDVRLIHAGKPPATPLSFLPRQFMPIARRLLPHERLREYQRPERRRDRRYSFIYILRMVLVAYDRRRLLRRALRLATAGAIVVSDRYPSQQIGATDSSCFDDAALAASRSWLKRWLMVRERALYRDVPSPRLIIRLAAPFDIAIARDAQRSKRSGPDPEALRRRWDLEGLADFPGTPVIHIDTSQSLEATARLAVRSVWKAL